MISHLTDSVSPDIAEHPEAQQPKQPLRVVICGSDEHGKSAVISRLLHEARRKFALVELPGAEQSARKILTGTPSADVVVILLDGCKGLIPQAKRHTYFARLIGARRAVLAVDNLELVGYSREVFERIEAEYREFGKNIGLLEAVCIPLLASSTRWYQGPTLLSYLESVDDGIDISRGDLLCAADCPAEVADQFEATLLWMGEQPMLPGRRYLMKIGARTVGATVTRPKYKLNVDTLERLAARTLAPNEIGVCNLHLDDLVAFDPDEANRDTASFVLVDRLTHETIGAGVLHFALRRSHNIHWQALELDKRAHAALKGQRPCIVWFTGLSGAGKSTIANLVEKKLHALGKHTYVLDGDNVRHGLNKDLGFTEADRVENIRRVAEVANLMVDAGLIVLVSFISPFRAERRLARELVDRGEFCEVFVDTPLEVAEQRDAKGLYKKARRGELKNFTGIDSPYERPESPEIRIDTTTSAAAQAADLIIARLREMRILEGHAT